ncbi:MAG: bifunctional diaminohydroxyphosphoribosylaminopyrimidine deaminase/5-amino-6-(5-phosphoribosylamino)uracil reductase RibD [Bacillota bacterium]
MAAVVPGVERRSHTEPGRTAIGEHFMDRALALAERAAGRTSPNPMVGAVVVKDGRVVGEGYHAAAGQPHAEVVALRRAGEAARGATLYVTLEPCCHFGRTPPCTREVMRAGVARVVAAMLDPNPRVAGRGVEDLRRAGIEVQVGCREEEARRLNEAFCKYIATGIPFVTYKAALSLDGKVATAEGDSRWISGEESRRLVHRLRDRYDAVMVGIGTVLADDPLLTCRIEGGRDPVRVVVDSRGRLPVTARLLRSGSPARTLVATTATMSGDTRAALEAIPGVEVIELPSRGGRVDPGALVRALGEREITSVLLEGGPTLAASFLAGGWVDKIMFFLAPLLVGGAWAPSPLGGEGVARLREARRLRDVVVERVGGDVLVTAYVVDGPGEGAGTCSPAS